MNADRLDPDAAPASIGPFIPGPRARFPYDLPLQMGRDMLGFLERTHRDCGDVARFKVVGTTFFLISHPDAVREVLVAQDDAFIKGPALQRARPVLGEGLLTSEGAMHRAQRRLIQPALHPQRVATYTSMMTDYAERLSRQWTDGQRVDLHGQMMALTLQVAAKALFGAKVEHEIASIGAAMDITVRMFTRAMSPFGRILDRLPLPSNFRFRRAHRSLLRTVEGFIARRRAEMGEAATGHTFSTVEPTRGDLLSRLLEARDVETTQTGMTDAQIRDECLTLFTAGHETTANALTFSWMLLARHPEAYAALVEELDRVLAERTPTTDDVERLAFTRAVLSESMRLYPPAWALGRQATRTVEIGGVLLPKDAVVLVSQWVVHRDARWWPDPLKFDPQRWIAPAPLERPRWAYFPFGAGTRSCVGEAFAWTEAILLLATLEQHWRVEAIDASLPALLPTITLRPREPVWMRLHRRNGPVLSR